MASNQLRPAFDEDDKKYLCCCCCRCHSRKGTIIITVLLFIYVIALQGVVIGSRHLDIGSTLDVVVSEIQIGITIIVAILLAVAVKKEKKELTLPYMILQIIYIAGSIIAALIAIIAQMSPDSFAGDIIYNYYKQGQEMSLTLHGGQTFSLGPTRRERIVGYASKVLYGTPVTLLLSIWFLHTVYTFYTYLKDKEEARKHMPI